MPAHPKVAAAVAKIELERTSFRSLLLSNPNYFGTLKGSKLQAVKALSGNSSSGDPWDAELFVGFCLKRG